MKQTSVKLCFAIIAIALAPACFAQATTPKLITACVAHVDGFSRIVAAPSSCSPRFETVVQWNSTGPAGATGPQGVAGPTGPQGAPGASALAAFQAARVIPIAANQSPDENGLIFTQTIAGLTGLATATTPYEVFLGPGQFTLPPAGVIVPPFVSLRGAGMFTTVLTGSLTFTDSHGQVENTFQLDELSVVGANDTIIVPNAGNVAFDHVFSNGIVVVNNQAANISILVTNSILKFPFTVNANGVGTHVSILSTELDYVQNIYSQGTVVCSGTFNASGTFYSNICKPNSTISSSTP